MEKKNQFLFMYPTPEYFNAEIEMHAFGTFRPDEGEEDFNRRYDLARTDEEKLAIKKEAKKYRIETFRALYHSIINQCIAQRYRQKGFGINFAVFTGQVGTGLIEAQEGDNIFSVGVDFKTHISERKYADPDYVLSKVLPCDHLRLAGFHMWDCVEKVAKCAYAKGVDILVDEDLTEFLGDRIRLDSDFRTDVFPTHNARKREESEFEDFMNARKKRPWLWQQY
jgi:hypothetical protein